MPDEEGWNTWSKYVLKELERLNNVAEAMNAKLDKVITDITVLKMKAGVWGLIGGMIPILIALCFWMIQKL